MENQIANCSWCGTEFKKKRWDQKYCCRACYEKNRNNANRIRNHCNWNSSEDRKRQILEEYMADMKLMRLIKAEKTIPPERLIVKFESDVYPDGCVFVHTSSSGGYWKKGVAADACTGNA